MSDSSPASGRHPHRQAAKRQVSAAVVTVSDTRSTETDTGGASVQQLLEGAGHRVVERRIVPDEPAAITAVFHELSGRSDVEALVFTGGTGVAPRDITPDTLEPLLDRVIPGFGELFRALSYQEIGSAALLSRALAGLTQGRVVFVLPGSRGAVKLALEKLLLPELGHLVAEAVKTR